MVSKTYYLNSKTHKNCIMNVICRYYSKVNRDFYATSSIKVFRKSQSAVPKLEQVLKRKCVSDDVTASNSNEYAENPLKVQMISRNLHAQIFGEQQQPTLEGVSADLKRYIFELRRHGIDVEGTNRVEDVKLKLPQLRGNIEEHFLSIAKEQVQPYKDLLEPLVGCHNLPPRPKNWAFSSGWTMYDRKTGHATAVDHPSEDALVMDVEVCVTEGGAPIMATAVSTQSWYSWVSARLTELSGPEPTRPVKRRYTLMDMIPLGMRGPKIVVGHNVSYDRARVREQYLLEDTCARFLDTMSLHICISGITSYQRAMLKSKKEPNIEDTEWLEQSALNSLAEVHRLYCGGKPLSKEARNVFVEGSLADIRSDFQNLVNYCADDVDATHRVLSVIYPLFAERFPHPATLAGMLEIGSAYLPVNTNWMRYINESNLAYEDLNIEAKYHLSRRADEACSMLSDERYRQHLWLWDEDWSVQDLKIKQTKSSRKKISDCPSSFHNVNYCGDISQEERRLQLKFQHLYSEHTRLPLRRPLLPGYPAWYRKLCEKPPQPTAKQTMWTPGPINVSTGMQIAPKLLSLCWEGYPLHYVREHGWGFLVPFRLHRRKSFCETHDVDKLIPLEQLVARCSVPEFARNCGASASEIDDAFYALSGDVESKIGRRDFYSKAAKDCTAGQYKGSGEWCNKVLQECCFFLKLPHKNGKSHRVGSPLSRDFLNKFADNVLSSGDANNTSAARVIEIARMMSYWRNNRDRIMGQMVVWLPDDCISSRLRLPTVSNEEEFASQLGAICPQVVACGTLTRRAMEPTWLTASNSQRERIGSELRAMVQAPRSYKIIGADVDSQELWIASVLGDAYACGEHGATPLGWMTLSGAKANGTDMHSMTAKAVGISRDHAKVINYARIYGAGQNFAQGLLKQFNPTLSASEAKSKAMKMFAITKGKRTYRLRERFHDQYEDKTYTSYEAQKIAVASNCAMDEIFHKPQWVGGTESAMFNRLEEIASSSHPVTPFLKCRLSRSLELSAGNESRFLPTRVNWVVQSGAVDFLHLMLVAMRWLMGPHVRFCLSFHDELRYLVPDEMAYKAALAMHITNLLTRSFCASRIGLTDLPMSVAFFSSVEVDTVLRKESTMDCKTPSNPHGLHIGYGIAPGESLNIYEAIKKAGCIDVSEWEWIR